MPDPTQGPSQKQVTRDLNEEARDYARAQMATPEFAKSRDERKKVEMRFAHLKLITVFNACACVVCPAPAMSSTSPPSRKTSGR